MPATHVAIITLVMTSISFPALAGAAASSCSAFPPFSPAAGGAQLEPVATLRLWQGAVLIVSFGVFALLVSIIFRLIRKRLYNDDHLTGTFFDAGGDVNFAMVASGVIARWLWTSSYTWSTLDVYKYGLVGHFWYSAASVVPLLLFTIVACELRIKAPGAKTFLQVIKRRFGTYSHVVLIAVALIVNVLVAGVVKMEGVQILSSLTHDFSQYAVAVLLIVVVGLFTAVGGLGGGLYFSYFAVAFAVSVALAFFIEIVYNPANQSGILFPSGDLIEGLYNATTCAVLPDSVGNLHASAVTFHSHDGLLEAVLIVLCGFSSVFVNQSFWQTAIIANPAQVVLGYLSAALAFFAIPLLFSFTFGAGYWAYSVRTGSPAVSLDVATQGYLPVIMSHLIWGRVGDFLMYALTLAVVISLLSSQIVSIMSIILYDIYQTYIDSYTATQTSQSAQTGDAAKHARRLKFVTIIAAVLSSVAVFVAAILMIQLEINLSWMFKLIGIIAGSSVIPVFLSITWHRTTGFGVLMGVLLGFSSGLIGWLVYASTFDGGITVDNTGRPLVFITGITLSLGGGGLACLLFSLLCGGCRSTLLEDEEWEKTAQIDSIVSPWSERYAAYVDSVNYHTKRPHYFQVAAYLAGILLSLGVIIVWPALMLLADVFSKSTFVGWTLMVFIWGIVAAVYVGVVPPILELLQHCRNAEPGNARKPARLQEDNVARTLHTVRAPDSSAISPRPAMSLPQTRPVSPPPQLPPQPTFPIPVVLDVQSIPHYHGELAPATTYVRPTTSLAAGTSSNDNRWTATVHVD